MAGMVERWLDAREQLRLLERAEHPDITDRHGRVWSWKADDLYRHDNLCFPEAFVTDDAIGLPSEYLASNPNYQLCGICTQHWSTAARQAG